MEYWFDVMEEVLCGNGRGVMDVDGSFLEVIRLIRDILRTRLQSRGEKNFGRGSTGRFLGVKLRYKLTSNHRFKKTIFFDEETRCSRRCFREIQLEKEWGVFVVFMSSL